MTTTMYVQCRQRLEWRGNIVKSLQAYIISQTGRILNRFSKDVGFLDDLLPLSFINYLFVSSLYFFKGCSHFFFCFVWTLQLLTRFFAIIITAAAANYWILFPAALVMVLFLALRWYYLKTARDVKRLEAICKWKDCILFGLVRHLSSFLSFLQLAVLFIPTSPWPCKVWPPSGLSANKTLPSHRCSPTKTSIPRYYRLSSLYWHGAMARWLLYSCACRDGTSTSSQRGGLASGSTCWVRSCWHPSLSYPFHYQQVRQQWLSHVYKFCDDDYLFLSPPSPLSLLHTHS